MIYLDSSVFIEAYLGQERQREALNILSLPAPKVSSWLLAVEVPIELRRLLIGGHKGRSVLKLALEHFDQDIKAISLFRELTGIAERVRRDERFAGCRALDAVHVGTAVLVQEMTNQKVDFASFDTRQTEVAKGFGLRSVSALYP